MKNRFGKEYKWIVTVIFIAIICSACGKEKDEQKTMASVAGVEYLYDSIGNGGMISDSHVSKVRDVLKEDSTDFSSEEFEKIMQCLWEQVPEISNWSDYVADKSEGKAHIGAQLWDFSLDDVYRDYEKTEFLGKYYLVYVGEQWEDHRVLWAYFYVNDNFDEVLWYDIVMGEDSEYPVLYLDEWRDSDFYPKLDNPDGV